MPIIHTTIEGKQYLEDIDKSKVDNAGAEMHRAIMRYLNVVGHVQSVIITGSSESPLLLHVELTTDVIGDSLEIENAK